MKFSDKEFDVYVTEGALAIVHRGDHISSAQMFGVDWDGPSHAVIHVAAFETPAPSGARPRSRLLSRLTDSAGRYLLGCLFSAGVGWTLAWLAWLAWK